MQKKYDDVPSYDQARESAGLPKVVDAATWVDKDIVILDWTPATRRLPSTGEVTEGFEVDFTPADGGEAMMMFVGGIVLVRELKKMSPPFRTKIRRDGQTYRFS